MEQESDKLIVRDPHICAGEPVVRETRVTLRTIFASLAKGAWIDEILLDFPTLTATQVVNGIDLDFNLVVPVEPTTWGRIKSLYR